MVLFLQSDMYLKLEYLAVDLTVLEPAHSVFKIIGPFKNLKSLTLKISCSFLENFYKEAGCSPQFTSICEVINCV